MTFPIYSVVDLSSFEHDPTVEQYISLDHDDTSIDVEVCSLFSDDSASTRSISSSDEENGPIHWQFVRTNAIRHSKRHHKGPQKKRKRARPPVPLHSVAMPDFVDVAHMESSPAPNVLEALNRSAIEMQSMGINVQDYYDDLAVQSVHLSKALAPKGHVDGGALATTTDRLDYIWSYREFTDEQRKYKVARLKVADDTIHIPSGCGFLKVPCDSRPGFIFVETFYTPEIPATILSPDAMSRRMNCTGYQTYSSIVNDRAEMELIDCSREHPSVKFDLKLIRGLLFTDSLIAPTTGERESPHLPRSEHGPPSPSWNSLLSRAESPDSPTDRNGTMSMNSLSREQSRLLWHMRLGHTNERLVSDLHKYADGIPDLPRGDVLDSCPICARSKLHKADRQPQEEKTADECWQHIQIDHGFIVQKSGSRAPATSRKKTRARSHNQFRATAATTVRPLTTSPRPSRSSRFQGSYSESQQRDQSRRPIVETVPDDDSVESSAPGVASPQTTAQRQPADEQTYEFSKILTHQGPLTRDHKNYRGNSFNLKIEWDTGQTTWEPLHIFFEDAPDAVIEYARQHNLLDNPHWSNVREAALRRQEESPSLGSFSDDHDEVTQDPVLPAVSGDYTYNVSERYKTLQGIHGETCYVLITDRKSGAMKVGIRRDKSPPIDFLKTFLAHFAPNIAHKTVRFDGGGDLGGCKELQDIFVDAGYEVETTAADSSNEIGMVERPHRTIAAAIRTMLYSAGLEPRFWPYALRYHEMIHNMLPHAGRSSSAHEICTGRRPDLRLLRIFGCRIYALPSKERSSKLEVHANRGIFLGYKKSMRNAIYYDLDTKTIKTARHIAFDEAVQDAETPPPYVPLLKGIDTTAYVKDVDLDKLPDLSIIPSPFTSVTEIECEFHPDGAHPLGFQFGHDPRYLRAFATSFNRPFGKFAAPAANRKFIGAYILKVGKFPTFSPDDVAKAIAHYSRLREPPGQLLIRLATDKRTTLSDSRPPALSLRPADIRRICAINLVAGEGSHLKQRAQVRELSHTYLPSYTPADSDDLIVHSAHEILEMRKLVNDHMTPEERALKHFTRKNLMKLKNWHQWQEADDLQLDTHFKAGTIGHPVSRPIKDEASPSQVFRIHWARLVKSSGVRKSRACLDGSKRAAPWLRMLVQTYSSCVDLACLRAFVGICVNRGYYICFGDVENAYQQSPPPTIDCFLEIDDTIDDWYQRRFGIKLDRVKQVIPLHRALQGHPEAGVLWERMITDILINKMGFKNTTHEKNLYTGTIDGQEVLVCRQVDDFASGAATQATAEKFITALRKHVEAEYAGMGVETSHGIFQRYNGIDVFQAKDHVILNCATYLDRMMETHGWEDSGKHPLDPDKVVPINPSIATRLQSLQGPQADSVEGKSISARHGFKYRAVLGELIYAYVICRMDIGESICLLARFSDAPHDEHYKALKSICRYLRATKDRGLVFQRPKPLPDLPDSPFAYENVDASLPTFPVISRDQLVGFFDAAHATALLRRSVTGLVLLFCGVAIAWKSRTQPVTATSSTEAEFYAAVVCAKMAKYLRYVLQELEALAPGPTELHVDNQAALAMVNESRPTPRARHIEIQHFAIQEWRQHGDIILRHIPGILNPSDALTKALGYVLHHRHTKRSMGHYRLDSTNFGSNSIHFPRTIEAGEGVRAQESSDLGSGRCVTQEGTQGVPDTVIPPKTRSGERTQPHDESLGSQFDDAGGALPNAPHNVEKV